MTPMNPQSPGMSGSVKQKPDPNLQNFQLTEDTFTTDVHADEEGDIVIPRDSDVLGGRGGKALRHPGNQIYRRLVNLNKGSYSACQKSEKIKLSRSIVAAVRERNGRFLDKRPGTDTWYDIGDKKAVEKTSQALREKQPETKVKIKELGGGAVGAQALLELQLEEERLQAQTRLSASGVLGGITGDASQVANVHGSAHSLGGATPSDFADIDFGSMDPDMLAAAAGFLPEEERRMSGRMLQPMPGDSLSKLPHERTQILADNKADYDDMEGAAPPLGPISTRDVSMELMKLGAPASNAQQDLKLPTQSLPSTQEDEDQDNDKNSRMPPAAVRLRPSLTLKGSVVREELGMITAQTSTMSLMSDFSGFEESTMSVDEEAQRINSLVREFGMNPTSSLSPMNSFQSAGMSPQVSANMDRRKMFAKMKPNRPASEVSDGMPDFHPVESTASLFSNMSIVGKESRPDHQIPSTNSRVTTSEVAPESRRSIMSASSENQSIFSDLSRKIGNISTKSFPMDDMSFLEESEINGTEQGEQGPSAPLNRPSLTMDCDEL